MNKSLLIALAFLSASALAFAGPKPKKAETWIDASVKAKSELRSQLQKAGMPVISKWMKAKDKAEPFVVDLKTVTNSYSLPPVVPTVPGMTMPYGETLALLQPTVLPSGWIRYRLNTV